jgi:hypothetical protein
MPARDSYDARTGAAVAYAPNPLDVTVPGFSEGPFKARTAPAVTALESTPGAAAAGCGMAVRACG